MKKMIFVLLSLVLAGPAFAENLNSQTKALDWVRLHLTGKLTAFSGVTAAGRPCGLFLTDMSYGDTSEYYVVVGYPETTDMNNYIGMLTSTGRAKGWEGLMEFDNNQNWGNGSRENHVRILLGENGNPIRAIGKSDLREINCKLR